MLIFSYILYFISIHDVRAYVCLLCTVFSFKMHECHHFCETLLCLIHSLLNSIKNSPFISNYIYLSKHAYFSQTEELPLANLPFYIQDESLSTLTSNIIFKLALPTISLTICRVFSSELWPKANSVVYCDKHQR